MPLATECERLWKNSVRGQRNRIARLLSRNPSLRLRLWEALAGGYGDALRHFTRDKLIELCMPDHLPGLSPFDGDDRLADGWWPELRGAS